MRGRPFEVTWREEDATEALKAAYRRERDIELRTRLHGLWSAAADGPDDDSHRWPQQLVFIIALYSGG